MPTPSPYRSILVGTDGSSTANTAVSHAMSLAHQFGAKLVFVCAYTPDRQGGEQHDRPSATPSPASAAEMVLAEVAQLANAAGIIDVETYARPGNPADAIIDVAELEGSDLIVVGSVGMTGARRFLLGSVPNNVSHQAPCSVLIVRTS